MISGLAALAVARIGSGPNSEQAATARFTALIDRQEAERVKLEKVAAELEVMVVLLLDWADQVEEKSEEADFELPPRPKFRHFEHIL